MSCIDATDAAICISVPFNIIVVEVHPPARGSVCYIGENLKKNHFLPFELTFLGTIFVPTCSKLMCMYPVGDPVFAEFLFFVVFGVCFIALGVLSPFFVNTLGVSPS